MMYKLRDFAIVMLQLLNEGDKEMKDAMERLSQEKPGRVANFFKLEVMAHKEGIRLIINCADRNYHMQEGNMSYVEYANIINKEAKERSCGSLPSNYLESQHYDPLFDDI